MLLRPRAVRRLRERAIEDVSARAAALPLATKSCCTVVSAGRSRRASGESSKPTTDRSSGHPQPQLLGGVHDRGGHEVGEAQHRGRPVLAGEQRACALRDVRLDCCRGPP